MGIELIAQAELIIVDRDPSIERESNKCLPLSERTLNCKRVFRVIADRLDSSPPRPMRPCSCLLSQKSDTCKPSIESFAPKLC